MITFKYQDKQYTTNNLQKKLLKLGITEQDIVICKNGSGSNKDYVESSIQLYKFFNQKDGTTISSIYSALGYLIYNHSLRTGLKDFNIADWVLIE